MADVERSHHRCLLRPRHRSSAFGHAGERELHLKMLDFGGFEGNGQTLRIITRLEKSTEKYRGINPTRRLILAVLKYPNTWSNLYNEKAHEDKPPKCFLDTEANIVDWAMEVFNSGDRNRLTTTLNSKGNPACRTMDASIMECADDIAYGVHDLEDIVARKLAGRDEFMNELRTAIESREHAATDGTQFGPDDRCVALAGSEMSYSAATVVDGKRFIGRLVHLFISTARLQAIEGFDHPLLSTKVSHDGNVHVLLAALKSLTFDLVINQARVQQLEVRGRRIVKQLFEAFISDPKMLIPRDAWDSMNPSDSNERRVCDYIAGMTDSYAVKIYRRLFEPGFGSSSDEL